MVEEVEEEQPQGRFMQDAGAWGERKLTNEERVAVVKRTLEARISRLQDAVLSAQSDIEKQTAEAMAKLQEEVDALTKLVGVL